MMTSAAPDSKIQYRMGGVNLLYIYSKRYARLTGHNQLVKLRSKNENTYFADILPKSLKPQGVMNYTTRGHTDPRVGVI